MSSKFSGKCKKGFHQNFIRSTTNVYWMHTAICPFDPIYIRFILCQISWRRWLVNYFIYFENHKSCVNEFLHCRYSKVSDSYFGCKVFCLFQQIFASEKVISKHGLHWEIKLLPTFNTRPHLSYSGVIRVEMFVLKHWVFL